MKTRLSLTFLVVISSCFALSGPVRAQATRDPRIEVARLLNEGHALFGKGKYEGAAERYRQAIAVRPQDPRCHVSLGKVLISIWRFDGAAEAFRKALELDSNANEARVWLARCEMHTYEYARAFALLQEALRRMPSHPDGRAIFSLLLIYLDEIERAEILADAVLADFPDHGFATVCKAHIHILNKKPFQAARLFAMALKKSRWNAAAYVGLGQALSRLGRSDDAMRILNEGVKRNPFLPPLYATRGFVCFKMKFVDGAKRNYRKALDLDIEYTGGHGIYSFFHAHPSESRVPGGEAGAALRDAVNAMEAGQHARAAALARHTLRTAPDSVFALLVLGAASYALEDVSTALDASRKAMALEPKAPLAHVLFTSSKGMYQEEKKLELSKVDFYEKFKALDAPEVAGVERVFVNYKSLTPDEKKVVRRAVKPFENYLPALADQGVTHYILPLYRHLTDVKAMSPWKGKPTFDQRSYDAVRGAAGQIAVSGVETLWPTTRLGRNTIAHEFAHQIHRWALSDAQNSKIKMLYKRAKKAGCCLDYYAAENEQEYFAQGYEAFVSPAKRPTHSETAKNTRADLERRDPDLYSFIQELTGHHG